MLRYMTRLFEEIRDHLAKDSALDDLVVLRENVTAEDGTKGPSHNTVGWVRNPGSRRYLVGYVYFACRTDASISLVLRPYFREPGTALISRGDAKTITVPDVTPESDDAGTNMTATATSMSDTSPTTLPDFITVKAVAGLANYYIADDDEGIGWIGEGGATTTMNVYVDPRLKVAGWAVGGTPANAGPYEIRKAVPFEITLEAMGQDIFVAVEEVTGTEGAFTASMYGNWVG